MSCIAHRALPKRDVSPVSAVQASVYAGSSRYGMFFAAVSDVSASRIWCPPDTADTSSKTQPYQKKPSVYAGCTPDTSDTCENSNVGCTVAANPVQGGAP